MGKVPEAHMLNMSRVCCNPSAHQSQQLHRWLRGAAEPTVSSISIIFNSALEYITSGPNRTILCVQQRGAARCGAVHIVCIWSNV
jgi:hypothetical protein